MMKPKRAQRRSSKARKSSGTLVPKHVKIDVSLGIETDVRSSRSSSLTPPPVAPPTVEVKQSQENDDDILSLREFHSENSVLTLYMEEGEEETESEHREEFFENFGTVPDIEDISEDISVAYVLAASEEELPKEVPEDAGKFVDPLSGQRDTVGSLAAEQDETIRPTTPEPEHKAKPEHDTDSEQEFKLSDLIITDSQMLGSQASELNLMLPDETTFFEDAGDGNGDKKHAAEEPKDALEAFFEMVNEEIVEEDEGIDWEAWAREYEAQVIEQQAKEFLTELIYKVVNKAEYLSDEDILAQNLDKRKLLMIFAEKCIEYETETTYNQMLDRRITNHLLRRKLFSQISPSKADAANKPKYFSALWKLEKHLNRESATRNKYESIKNALLQELKECEEKLNSEIQSFETLVKLKLSGNDLEHLNHRILPHVAEMREFRKRISETRFKLILIEDTHAKLKIKLDELEDLGNDLTLTDYNNLHNQNQRLQKKLEERNGDLQKLHFRRQKHIHRLAHYGATKDQLYQIIGMQRFHLEERKFELDYLRRQLQKLTLRRIRTRQQIMEMSLNAGLVDKPLLMQDYDDTIKILNKEREIVARLRATVDTLQSKINVLEKRLSTNHLSIKGKEKHFTQAMTKDWRSKEKRLTKLKKVKKHVRGIKPQSTSALASRPLTSSSSSPASSARSSSSSTTTSSQSSSSSKTSSYSLTSSEASSSSSSTSSTRKSADSTDLTKSRQRAVLENLHQLLRANVEVSSDEEDEEQEAECDEDFFETFQELPDIQDISIDTEETKPRNISGQFVDPLKDLELYHPPPVAKQETVVEVQTAPSKKSSSSETESLKSEFDNLLTTDDYSTGGTDTFDNEPKVIAKPEDLFNNLLEFTLESVEEEDVTEEDWGAAWDTVWARERAAEQLKRDALEFLDDLILKVVKIDRSATAQLREKLDKRKLLVELAEKYKQFQLESEYLKLLQRNVEWHMKRKNSSSSLESDNITELAANKSRYKENFLLLEKQLVRESATMKKCQATKETVLKEYKEEEKKTANQIRSFEKLVRTTLSRPLHHVNLLIEQPLQELAKYRKEVSDVRLQLILKHQSYIELKKKLHYLDDLGDGLTAKSFFHILHETKELEASIKERNADLKKLHKSTERSIHMLAHCKEKQDKLQSIMVQQHRKLNELQARRLGLRRRVQELTQTRMRIQTQLNDERLRAGLLDKPLLLKDYDETVERIKQQRENNANLRATMLAIEAKIKRFEKILADNRAKTMILY